MLFSYVLPAVLIAVHGASAAATIDGLLVARQTASDILDAIPPQCQSDCGDASSILGRCGAEGTSSAEAAECICTRATISALDSCFGCLVNMASEAGGDAAGDIIKEQADMITDQLETTCRDAGRPIGGSGGSGNTGSSSTGGSGSSPTRSSGGSTPTNGASSPSQSAQSGGNGGTGLGNGDSGSSNNDDNNGLPGLDGSSSRVSLGVSAVVAAVAGAFLLL